MKTLGDLCKKLCLTEAYKIFAIEDGLNRIKRLYTKDGLEDLSPEEVEQEVAFLEGLVKAYEEDHCILCGDKLVSSHMGIECLSCGYIAYTD